MSKTMNHNPAATEGIRMVFYESSKKAEENKMVDSFSIVLLEALAERFPMFGECDVRPRHFHSRGIGGPGRG